MSSLYQEALFSLAEDLNESETLFISLQNLPATKRPKNFYLKKSLTEQDKKFTLPFALEGIFVYLYRETEYYSNWTCCWEIRGKWSWRLLYGCSLRLLCVWRKGWKSCKDCWAEFFATLKLATKLCHIFSAGKTKEEECIEHWSGFCGPK